MNDTANLLLLIFNAILWGTTSLYCWYKFHYFSLGISILLFYTIISFIDIHLFFSPQYVGLFEDLSFFPFLYLYIAILLVLYPLLRVKENRIFYIYKPSTFLYNITIAGLIFFSLYGFWNIVAELPKGIIMLLTDNEYGLEAYQEGLANLDRSKSGGINILDIGCNAARAIVPAFMIHYYATSDRVNKIVLIGLIVSSLLGPLQAIAKASRLDPAIFIINMLFLYVFWRNFIPKKRLQKLKSFFLILFFLICIPFMCVSLSRAGGDFEKTFYSLERYTAESFIRFNNYGLNANGCRYGDKTIPAFKELCGLETARTYSDRLHKYYKMNMNESVFYTFVGDFTLDYGAVLTIVIFLFTAIFFGYTLKIRGRILLFHQYLLLYLLLYGCVGFFQFPLADINGNMRIILLSFLILIFKLEYDLNKK